MKLLWAKFCYMVLRPLMGPAWPEDEVDIYACRMLRDFNRLHRFIFPHFFSKTRVDSDSLASVKEKIADGIPIYITTSIGQLEYNFYNYLFIKEGLPLAEYVNGLSNWQWMPLKLLKPTKMAQLEKRIEAGGSLPHPVSSGHVRRLIGDGKSILVRLKTTPIFDDLAWEIPEEDVVQALVAIQKGLDCPLYLVPQQFLWAKRPVPARKSIIDLIFGERESPGRLRKAVLFWRNYKRHAVAQSGEVLNLKEFLDAHPSIPDEELARILRSALLSQIREERQRITGPALKPRRFVIEKITEAEAVQREVYGIAAERKKDVEDVKMLARRYAKAIVADISYSYVEFACRVLNWAFNNMYEGIHTNQESLAEIKKIAQRHPIIFVPNHRSHVDYLLLSTLLYGNDISVPHVAAGENLSFWPLGAFFRRCGAFFLRRTFGGNKLYKAVFKAYLCFLIEGGYCLEFFIEGGRSRTGKLRQPMMGMLSMIAEAMDDGAAGDLYFIPTSITYDKVAEEGSYVSESAGGKKKKERFIDILRLGKYAKRRYGKIYVNFGRPISFVKTAGNDRRPGAVQGLAYLIMNSLGDRAVVTPHALTSTAIMMEERRGITSEELGKNVRLIKSYLKYSGAQLADTLLVEPGRSIQEALGSLSSQKLIEAHTDFDPVYYSFSEEARAAMSYQMNSIAHFLVPVACVSAALLSLLKKGEATCKIDDVLEKIAFLEGLFTYEFAASEGLMKGEAVSRTIAFLKEAAAIEMAPDTGAITITTVGSDTLRRYRSVITNILDTYRIALHTCTKIPENDTIDDNSLTKAMFKTGRHMLLLGKISRFEAISTPAFESAINLFKSRGYLVEEPSAKDSKERKKYRRASNTGDLSTLQQALELFS